MATLPYEARCRPWGTAWVCNLGRFMQVATTFGESLFGVVGSYCKQFGTGALRAIVCFVNCNFGLGNSTHLTRSTCYRS